MEERIQTMKINKLISIILALALLLTVFAGCGKSDTAGSTSKTDEAVSDTTENNELKPVRLVLDWTPNTNHTGLYVALENGYFEEEGLSVELLQPPESGAVPLLAAGNAEYAISFQEEMGPAIAKDDPLPVTAVAAIINHNTSGIISLKDSGIDSPKKLEGKRFACWDSPLVNNIVRTVVEEDGGDFEQVDFIYNNVTDVVSALQADIDAVWVYWAWDGVAAEVSALDINYFDFIDYYPTFDYYTPVILSNNTYMANNPEDVKAFMRAVSKGYNFAIENPEDAADILVKNVPELNPDLVLASQKFLAEAYQSDSPRWGEIDSTRWGSFYKWMYEEGLLDNDLGESGFTNEFLPEN